MRNKLFLVCPFSSVEPLIQNRYGKDIFFLTAPASLFKFEEEAYLQEVRHFIAKNRPEHIYIVHDTSCRFLRGIILGQEQPAVAACTSIRDIFQRNLQTIMRAPELEAKVEKLAECCMIQQTIHLIQPHVLGNEIMKYGIQIKGLITNRQSDDYRELDINMMMD